MITKFSIFIYTHSDCTFIWPVLIGQFDKWVDKDIEVHFVYNSSFKNIQEHNIPKSWILHTYDEKLIWTKRVHSILLEIPSEYVLFIHEDWLPTGKVDKKILDDVIKFMDNQPADYMMSYSHIITTSAQKGIETGYPDYFYYKEGHHVFQPSIWRKTTFEEFTHVLNKMKTENEGPDCLNFMGTKKCYAVQNEKTVTKLRSTNSLFFPHMHALAEGQWTFIKYPNLRALIESYGINTNTRGIHTQWEVDTQ